MPARVARYAKRSFLTMPRTPEAMFFDNFASIGLGRQAAEGFGGCRALAQTREQRLGALDHIGNG